MRRYNPKVFYLLSILPILFLSVVSTTSAEASPNKAYTRLFIYPSEGQSPEQLEKDRYDCYQWAKKNSDIDPLALKKPKSGPVKVAIADNPNKGNTIAGTIIGAVIGAAIGSQMEYRHGRHSHNQTFEGAIAGAGIGTLIGATSEAQGHKDNVNVAKAQAHHKAAQQAEENKLYKEQLIHYNRVFSACMEARNYSVK
ncbi:glycine zipper family protein [Marinibactrum halimedae]|uniref:Glycine zipper 2TM domain-containing protein n=1 Tax=Marinibactrum halimedae TaxID=1444977 RepID=A0AA37T0W6_9GAMM|nr:glycine zipper family protein [Marinibactrum halimedae]MCD9457787.1 YMGG-like glycine zipper-containing protein [Marinibactrum halimedae]GLS24839.1 hypothetical protein GCM10007877_05530 [Marinibactrum halimedae]